MVDFSLEKITQASELVYQYMLPTPQYNWPQLSQTLGTELWVKHENHTATGSFKIRGGITYLDWLKKNNPMVKGIITATRGNHGQSQARAGRAQNFDVKIIVPKGNSIEKNAAMRSFGAEVVEFGEDFDAAKQEAARIAEHEELFPVPAFHSALVLGVASYALELFTHVADLDVVYVPIGCGSGICGVISVRDALGLKTEVVGVVSTEADAVKQSFEKGRIIKTSSANTFADGVAVREPIPEAFFMYSKGASRIVSVPDTEIAAAMRMYFACTHNMAEGAGAISLAAALREREQLIGKRVGVVLTGGNIDTEVYASILRGGASPK